MSDDEEVMRSDEEEGSEEEEEEESKDDEAPASPVRREAEDSGPSEAQLAMQKRRQVHSVSGLDDEATDLLENNKLERARMEEEIEELRQRSEQRKKERQEEERRLAEKRAEEEARRKAEEEERKRKKEQEEQERKAARAQKLAEFEKWKNPPTRNFVITKKERTGDEDEEDENPAEEKKSKEQLEAEKQAILKQRVHPLEISGFDTAKLAEKAKELHTQIYRLESERYDLERRFKAQQYDMMELAERARQMNKVGKQGSLKRVQLSEEDSDKIQERFAGCPGKILMYSAYERQKDKRDFGNRRELYVGPVYGYPADRIKPQRIVKWNDEGLPNYEYMEGCAPPEDEE